MTYFWWLFETSLQQTSNCNDTKTCSWWWCRDCLAWIQVRIDPSGIQMVFSRQSMRAEQSEVKIRWSGVKGRRAGTERGAGLNRLLTARSNLTFHRLHNVYTCGLLCLHSAVYSFSCNSFTLHTLVSHLLFRHSHALLIGPLSTGTKIIIIIIIITWRKWKQASRVVMARYISYRIEYRDIEVVSWHIFIAIITPQTKSIFRTTRRSVLGLFLL